MPFVPQKVFEDRANVIREWLGEQDYEALIVSTPDNFYMVSGFHLDVAPWERPVAAVIPREGEPFLVMNELSTNHLKFAEERKSLFITDYTFYAEHPRTTNRTWNVLQFGDLVAYRLAERGITKGRVAVEGSGPRGLQAAAPRLELEDVTSYLISLREVKYPEELDVLRECAKLTDWAQDKYMELVKPGLNVKAFDLHIGSLAIEEAARRFPKDRFEPRMISLSGPASAAPHGTGADVGETFEKGHGVVNIIVFRLSGLVVESERTLFLGEPEDIQRRAFQAATDANEAAAAQMVAGNPVAMADAAAQQVIEEAGFGEHINHRTGHGIGIAGHEFPADMPFLHRPFKENEVFSSEPGIYIWGVGGFRHDDTVIVGKNKPEVITKRSRKLEDQIVSV